MARPVLTLACLAGLVTTGLLLAPGLLHAQAAPSQRERLADARTAAILEARRAEDEARRLGKAADDARDEALSLRARQAAAAQDILAAEARIAAADATAREAAMAYRAYRARLEESQAPAGNLLAGLALMASRPPLIALLDDGSTRDYVNARFLLEAVLPEIAERTRLLAAQGRQSEKLRRQAIEARAALAERRLMLKQRITAFAALEDQALERAEQQGDAALVAGDVALARGEDALRLGRQAERADEARAMARDLARRAAPPVAAFATAPSTPPGIAYRLPADAPVTEGFGSIGETGIRARGTTFATARGTAIVAPASGTIRFAGPFRNRDGIVIIDHGGGWASLLLNVSPSVRQGDTVRVGSTVGKAIGPIELLLSRDGKRMSPALIAGSSQTLSKGSKTR